MTELEKVTKQRDYMLNVIESCNESAKQKHGKGVLFTLEMIGYYLEIAINTVKKDMGT